MTSLLLLWVLGLHAHATPTASPTPLALDHVVIAVKDLESAKAHFSALGFRLKPGRLHTNNLLNHHIKFRDGSGLELMTLAGPPRDRMAEELGVLIASHDGGAYVALRTPDVNAIGRAASALGLSPSFSTSGT
jgi:catechol 2,3-dioxygenase-like lactoylglutathione lyase family enzyme